jgi:DOPA 4,5-dioxygenase
MCGPYNPEQMKEWDRLRKESLKKEFEAAQGRIEGYHVHIYFSNDKDEVANYRERMIAQMLGAELKDFFGDDVKGVYNVGVVGPHGKPNVEIDISRESFGRVVQWLQHNNSEGLSILVHPETGDDLKDHLENSLWLNKETPYNQAFFDRLRAGKKDAPVQKGGFTPK